MQLTEDKDVMLPPIDGSLSCWGAFTKTLHETLEELQTISGNFSQNFSEINIF